MLIFFMTFIYQEQIYCRVKKRMYYCAVAQKVNFKDNGKYWQKEAKCYRQNICTQSEIGFCRR